MMKFTGIMRVMILALLVSFCVSGMACAEAYTYADTISWDGEYDVVVAGFGGAGAIAAKNAADAGANVLLVEKAPEGEEGGNTRYAHQAITYGYEDAESVFTYFKALGGDKAAPDAMIKVLAESIADMDDVVAQELELNKEDFMIWGEKLPSLSPEYPHLPGGDKITVMTVNKGMADGAVWNAMKAAVMKRLDQIDVWYNSPAKHLIQDPQSKTIIGVQIERDGKLLNIRAKNGVVLATGGFENNTKMMETYLGYSNYEVVGTLHNTGDGVLMAQEVGADMWHMHVHEGNPQSVSLVMDEGQHASLMINAAFKTGSSMFVGENGKRFVNEQDGSKHGHVEVGGTWLNPNLPDNFFCVMDAANYALALENGLDEAYAYTYKGETIEEMAMAAGINAENLKKTVDAFNGFVDGGEDLAYYRAVSTMSKLAEGPYYAIKLVPAILNTQGGPRRNENAEVLGLDGNPIPNLYSAGELGGICAHHYQGGSNIAETIIYGAVAGKNAAMPKAELPAYVVLPEVESSITYTIGVENDLKASDYSHIVLGENEVLGIGEGGMGGNVVVKVTMDDDKIANVEVIEHKETAGISDPAIESVPAAIVAANSTEVDTVAGATITSKAIIEAVNNALSQVK